MVPTRRCSPPAPNPRRWLNPLCKLIPLRKAERLTKDPATRLSTLRLDVLQTAYPSGCRRDSIKVLGFPITYFGQISRNRTKSTRKELVSDSLLVLTCSDLCYTSCFFTSLFISHLSCFLTFWLRQLMHACICTTPIIFLPVSLYTFFFSPHVHVQVMKTDGFGYLHNL